MHATIAKRPAPWERRLETPSRPPGHTAARVYRTLHAVHGALGAGIALGTRRLADVPAPLEPGAEFSRSPAVLNGVCGDHLDATENPLAVAMSVRTLGRELECTPQGLARALPGISGHVVVWIHGLCMSEQGWRRGAGDPMSERLAEALGLTSVYVRYNSGRAVSRNGRELAELLDRLVRAWPVPVASLALIGHSMGGLVARSAGWHADRDGLGWRSALRSLICLGTPHHGSPLEKGGHWVDQLFRLSPYLEPLSLGRARSAGIKDLRHGTLRERDGRGHPEAGAGDSVPLLPGVDHCFAAATVGRHAADPIGHLLGDLLVRPGSATGVHADPAKHLEIEPENCRIFHRMHHFDLLNHPAVCAQLQTWLRRSVGA